MEQLSDDFIVKLKKWIKDKGSLFITAKQKMNPQILEGLNSLVVPFGVKFNNDILNPFGVDLPKLSKIKGFNNPQITSIVYDTGCSIAIDSKIHPSNSLSSTSKPNIMFSLSDGDLYGLIGIQQPAGGRIALCGTYWTWINHGSSGIRAGNNGLIIYFLLRWLAHLDVQIPLYLEEGFRQVGITREIRPEFFSKKNFS